MCESRGGRPGRVPGTGLRSCVKVEVDVLGSRPYKPTVSVDVKQHFNHIQRIPRRYWMTTCTLD